MRQQQETAIAVGVMAPLTNARVLVLRCWTDAAKQNRRQKVFSTGGFTFVQGDLTY